MSITTAGICTIGNEILNGSITDLNTPFLTRRLYELGIEVCEIRILPDRIDVIAQAIKTLHRSYDLIFTSGGMGPTPDDVTIPAVAQGLHKNVIVEPRLEQILCQYFQTDHLSPSQKRLARIPEGARLQFFPPCPFPQIAIENIYLLPGIPEILKEKFDLLAPTLPRSSIFSHQLEIIALETEIAPLLEQMVNRFPQLTLGSYPLSTKDSKNKVQLVLKSRSREILEQARDEIYKGLTELGVSPLT